MNSFQLNSNQELKKISPYFAYPLLEASVKLGVEMETLRKICKDNGIIRWPYSYKRKNETSSDNAFLKFTLPEVKKVTLPKRIMKAQTPCTLISKIQVKNLLN